MGLLRATRQETAQTVENGCNRSLALKAAALFLNLFEESFLFQVGDEAHIDEIVWLG